MIKIVNAPFIVKVHLAARASSHLNRNNVDHVTSQSQNPERLEGNQLNSR